MVYDYASEFWEYDIPFSYKTTISIISCFQTEDEQNQLLNLTFRHQELSTFEYVLS